MAKPRAISAPQIMEDEVSGQRLATSVVIGGKYRLIRPAGFGGMGAVWVACNEATGAEVAVKVLLPEDARSADARARFRLEAYAAAKLSHRGIVRVFDLVELDGEHSGALALVMELLRGETLADVLERRGQTGRGRLDTIEALEIVLPLLSALAHAHTAGIVHRDLKPENVFLNVDPDGHTTPKILDFGISKVNAPEAPRVTGDGALLGTPAYMSPEQARGADDVDARSDIFSMGILLYEMLAGINPFIGGSYHVVVSAILEREPEPVPDIAPAVWDAIAKALRKDRAQRWQSAKELAAALRSAVGPVTLSADSNPPPPLATISDPAIAYHPSAAAIRRSAPTLLDTFGYAKRRRRARRVAATVFGGGVVLAIAGFVLARQDGLLRGDSAPRVAPANALAPPPPATAVAPAVPPHPLLPALPAPGATASAAVLAPPEVHVDALPVAAAPTAAALASAATAPRASRAPHKPRAAAAPKEPPASPAAPPPDPLSAGVVRDPGF